jgi:hypothetical protein
MNTLVTTFLNMVNVVAPNSPGLADAIKANSDSAKSTNALVNTLKSTAASLRNARALPPENETPHACDNLDSTLDTLQAKLNPADFSAKSIKDSLAGWVSAIDSGYGSNAPSGPAGMQAGKVAVDNSIKTWNALVDDADKAIKDINACVVSQIPDSDPSPQAPPQAICRLLPTKSLLLCNPTPRRQIRMPTGGNWPLSPTSCRNLRTGRRPAMPTKSGSIIRLTPTVKA